MGPMIHHRIEEMISPKSLSDEPPEWIGKRD
jgi:hypothetical protein